MSDSVRALPSPVATQPAGAVGSLLRRRAPAWVWDLRQPIAIWLIARVALTVVAAWGATSQIMSAEIQAGDFLTPRLSGWEMILVDVWQRWDGQWYIKILTEGYHPEQIPLGRGATMVNPTPAFFPLYPAIVWIVGQLFALKWAVAGILVSSVACLAALIVLYRLACHEFGRAIAGTAVRYQMIFPTAFYFFAVYAESVFLLTSVTACYLAIRRHWLGAGVAGLLTTVARPSGLLILIPIGLEYVFWLRREGRRPGREVAALAIIPLGLVVYGAFLWERFGDPLAFIHAQENVVWARRARWPWEFAGLLVRSINPGGIPFPQGLGEGIRTDLIYGGFTDSNGYNLLLFLIAVGVAIAAFRFLRPSLAAYGLALVLFSIISVPAKAPLMAFPRHMLVAFPIFLVLAIWGQHGRVDRWLTYPAVIFLGIFTVRFATWYWVS